MEAKGRICGEWNGGRETCGEGNQTRGTGREWKRKGQNVGNGRKWDDSLMNVREGDESGVEERETENGVANGGER
jgi:hypothetical protein